MGECEAAGKKPTGPYLVRSRWLTIRIRPFSVSASCCNRAKLCSWTEPTVESRREGSSLPV